MDKSCWIGVDLGQKSFVAAVAARGQEGGWSVLPWKEFENSKKGCAAFVKWVRQLTKALSLDGVCVEALGPMAWDWVELLGERLGKVALVNPKRTANFARVLGIEDKTDRVDACVLALHGLTVGPVPRPLPSKSRRMLQGLTRFRNEKRADLQAFRNQLRNLALPAGLAEKAQVELERMERFVKEIDAEIAALIKEDERLKADCARLETIPGVGWWTAAQVLGELGDLRQFTRSEITAMAGLFPRKFESGTSVRKRTRLAKTGNRHLRSALYFPAVVAKKYCAPLARFAQRLREKGVAEKAIVLAVERKLLLMMRALLVAQEDYKDPGERKDEDNQEQETAPSGFSTFPPPEPAPAI